jgi:hypothetical protein
VRRVVLEQDLKRDYQAFLQAHNRGNTDSDGRPDRNERDIREWARDHDLPYFDGVQLEQRTMGFRRRRRSHGASPAAAGVCPRRHGRPRPSACGRTGRNGGPQEAAPAPPRSGFRAAQ